MAVSSRRRLPRVAVHHVDQFVAHLLRLLAALMKRGRGAVPQMVPHKFTADAAKRLMDRGDLAHDVGALPILFDHLLHAPNLTFDPL
jgi:hypothetical protein